MSVWSYIFFIGTDRPHLKYLYRHVKPEIASRWYEIGVELFDVDDEKVLEAIKTNNPGNADKCADQGELRKSAVNWLLQP